jgi:hypothetical protein
VQISTLFLNLIALLLLKCCRSGCPVNPFSEAQTWRLCACRCLLGLRLLKPCGLGVEKGSVPPYLPPLVFESGGALSFLQCAAQSHLVRSRTRRPSLEQSLCRSQQFLGFTSCVIWFGFVAHCGVYYPSTFTSDHSVHINQQLWWSPRL